MLIVNKLNLEDDFICILLIEIYIFLLRVEDENGNYDKVIEYVFEVKKYVRDEEGENNVDLFLVWLYDRYGNYIEVEVFLKNIINKSKNDEWLYFELGYCLVE